jgi:osmotically-inducible protein OsmY
MKTALLVTLLGLSAIVPLTGCAPAVVVGVGAGAVMASDRRTSGTYLMDQDIELKANFRLSERKLEGVHINFTSFNRRLLVTGETATAALKANVLQLAKELSDVREIVDEIVVAPPTDIKSRASDSYITTKVKARLLDDDRVQVNYVKVVTENGAVFLMGLVKREEGAAAAEIAAKTEGVRRVVKVFEYIN